MGELLETLTHISLFTGIGGIDIATEWAGFKTILMVENNAYCQKVLTKHWPDVPIIGDIRDVTKETIEEVIANADTTGLSDRTEEHRRKQAQSRKRVGGIGRRDTIPAGRRTNSISPITLITGGFPCQPVSQAGQQRGKEDDRWLWPEMLRVIKEVRPRWIVAENVAGLINMGLDDCISNLESEGYTVEPYLIPACAVNAPHRRDRIFIVVHDNSPRCEERWGAEPIRQAYNPIKLISEDVADTTRRRLKQCESQRETERDISQEGGNWAVEPELGRVASGIPHRVDRLKCLGNAVVPQQIYPIFKGIAEIENANK